MKNLALKDSEKQKNKLKRKTTKDTKKFIK